VQFSSILFQLMTENDETKYALAKAIGANKTSITNWLNGDTLPYPKNLEKIAQHYNVSCDFLKGLTSERGTFEQKNKPATSSELTSKEFKYIEKIKGLTEEQQRLLDVFLSGLENQTDKENQ